jgi:DNA-binding LacI/PurR family transcriptional regulator
MSSSSKTKMMAVALEAGVSMATVSRVLNNSDGVTDDKRKLVLEAVRNTGYVKSQRNLIGLIVPDAPNPFFSQLGFKFEQALESDNPRKYLITLCSEGRIDKEMEQIEMLKQFGVEGLIYISSGKSSEVLLNLSTSTLMPTIVFDRKLSNKNFDFVAVDSRQGTIEAVDYLVSHGHNRIAYLKGREDTESAKERFASFLGAMAKNQLGVNPDWIYSGDYTFPSGRTCAEFLLRLPESNRPSALLAANDVMAIAAMQRLQEAGWDLPTQFSIVGFDDIEWSKWCYPALTTIAQPIARMVLEALTLLKKRIIQKTAGEEPSDPVEVEIKPTLIPRGSVTKPFDQHVGLRVLKATPRGVHG